jgi:DNA-binding MarR family transcriptional regulator
VVHSPPPFRPSPEYRELAILTEIGRNSAVSQRALARAATVSPTMANAYVDRLVGRGFVEVSGDTNRTYRYALTEEGRRRREELLRRVWLDAVAFYGHAKREFRRRLEEIRASGVAAVALYGASETAELALLAAPSAGLRVAAVIDDDPGCHGARFGDFTVASPASLASVGADGVLVTSADGRGDHIERLEGEGVRVFRL